MSSGSGRTHEQAHDHPDDDMLADLGAGLLVGPAAREVEAHVVDCPVCLDLLERSEALAGPLRRLSSGQAGTMPADVVARLERALAEGASAGTGEQPRVATDSGSIRKLKPMTAEKVTRMARPSSGARRQQRGEERDDDRSSRLMRYGKWAAAAVLVVGVGVGAVAGVRALTGGQAELSATSAGGDAASVGVAVLATGTNYRSADLKKQVDGLITASRKNPTAVRAQQDGASGSSASGSSASPGTAYESAPKDAAALAGGTGNALADEATLNRCLSAIGRGGERPLAVDLARYQDQEAAVIVLQEPTGTYEVWVVNRTCAPGSETTIAVKEIQP